MKILILKSTVADGQPAQVGQVLDVSDADARILLRMGKASLAVDAEPVPAVLDTEAAAPVIAEDKRKGRYRGTK